jgi:DNA-binding NarL/FixJ family response regulator
MAKIRVFLTDDHTLFRQGIRTLISAEPDMEVVGEASNGSDAILKAAELRPDVILMEHRNGRAEQFRSHPTGEKESARDQGPVPHNV